MLRGADSLTTANAEVTSGGRTSMSSLDTMRVSFGRAVRKGGGVRSLAYAISATGQIRSPLASLGLGAGVGAAARVDAAFGSLELRGFLARAQSSTYIPAETWDGSLALAALYVADVGPFTLGGGPEAGWAVFRQYAGLGPERWVHAFVTGPTGMAELPLADRLHVRADLALPMYVLTLTKESGEKLALLVGVRGGLGFGGYF
jgi:hypothetical protein